MNYMRAILDEIKVRPGMFLGERNLKNLHTFMSGYMYQIFQEEDIIPEFYPGFQEYIAELYDVKTGQHWTKILDFYCDNEEEALKKFFQHLEEYTKIDESRKNNN